jgi:hypothetical protein
MDRIEVLRRAVTLIADECGRHQLSAEGCDGCLLCDKESGNCQIYRCDAPIEWNFDAWIKEHKNG